MKLTSLRLPTWRCDECKSEFKFLPITAVNEDVDRKFPEFCPYCGYESNFGAEWRTHFTEVGILDKGKR